MITQSKKWEKYMNMWEILYIWYNFSFPERSCSVEISEKHKVLKENYYHTTLTQGP